MLSGNASVSSPPHPVEKLARALRIVVSDEAMRNRAESLGERIRGEDGLSNAIAIIEGTYNAASEN